MVKQIKIKIYGKVQGVFFRDSAVEKASDLNLVGEVSNLADGTVEIVAEGEEENLAKLIEWAKIGPEMAEVAKIDLNYFEPTGNFSDFQVK